MSKDEALRQEIEAEITIRVEKLLLAKLGRDWTPAGISVVSLIDELAERAALSRPSGADAEATHFISASPDDDFMSPAQAYAIQLETRLGAMAKDRDGWRTRAETADAEVARLTARVGYVVANGDGTKWRTLEQGIPSWTDDREKAIHYARRCDAELAAEEDEDAWLIQSDARALLPAKKEG